MGTSSRGGAKIVVRFTSYAAIMVDVEEMFAVGLDSEKQPAFIDIACGKFWLLKW